MMITLSRKYYSIIILMLLIPVVYADTYLANETVLLTTIPFCRGPIFAKVRTVHGSTDWNLTGFVPYENKTWKSQCADEDLLIYFKASNDTSDQFDFVIHSFEFSGVDGVVAMVQDAVFEKPQPTGKPSNRGVIDPVGHGAPGVQGTLGIVPVDVPEDRLELILEQIYVVKSIVQIAEFPEPVFLVLIEVFRIF